MPVRMSILRGLSGLSWGLETRILAITAHALMESVIGFGLTVAGSALSDKGFRQLDSRVLNPAARHIAGVSSTTRREIMFALADIKSVQFHYLLKNANIVDRALRAGGARVRETIKR